MIDFFAYVFVGIFVVAIVGVLLSVLAVTLFGIGMALYAIFVLPFTGSTKIR